ncbi:MAG: hypothetical protein FWD56_05365, partial [Bacteroidales bacterium]|nr:hypothetical protein [Bacteroidales bacterium]
MRRFLPIFCCFALLVASCSKSELPEIIEISNNCVLHSFSFNAENDGIQSPMAGYISGSFAPDGRQSRP